MANEKHVDELLKGVESWNKWREEHLPIPECVRAIPDALPAPERGRRVRGAWRQWREEETSKAKQENRDVSFPDLSGVDFRKDRMKDTELWADVDLFEVKGVKLWDAHLEGADLREARLDGVCMAGANLTGAMLTEAHLDGANLVGTHLEGADLREANLTDAKVLWGRLEGANLVKANLTGAMLIKAHLDGANLVKANLTGAMLTKAHLDSANLRGACLDGANLEGADCTRADLRGAEELRLDDTRVYHARFDAAARDPWSVLRRNYSGPMFALHLLLLISFLVPYVARAMFWVGASKGQQIAVSVIEKSISTAAASGSAAQTQITDALNRAKDEMGDYFKDHGDTHRVWWVLLGLNRGGLRGRLLTILALVLVLYNVARGFVTWKVSRIRDAEERSGWSPAWDDYKRLSWIHRYFMRWVMYAAIISVLSHTIDWLWEPVWLPK